VKALACWESERKEEGALRYLVTQELVDPSPLLPPDRLLGSYTSAAFPSHKALINLKSEGKVIAGGYPVGERAIAFIVEADSPKELDSLLLEIPFWGITKTKVTPLQDLPSFLRRDLLGILVNRATRPLGKAQTCRSVGGSELHPMATY
jgi:hypothetical protein